MTNLLSQAEVDALLAAVQDDVPLTPSAARPTTPASAKFDLASRRQVKSRRLPGLEHLCKRFSEHFRYSLSEVLTQDIDVGLLELQFLPYAEYLHSLYLPTSLNMMRMEPLQGRAMMVFDARLVFRLVEIFFGGTTVQGAPDGRDFSPAERRLLGKLLSRAHADIEESWRPVLELQCQPLGTEVNPSMANIVGAADSVVVCRFQVDAEGGGGGEFHICFPSAMLEPLREALSRSDAAERRSPDPLWEEAMRRAVLDTCLPTRCRLAEKTMSLREIAGLQVGDVIAMGRSDQVEIHTEGQPLLRARIDPTRDDLTLVITGRA